MKKLNTKNSKKKTKIIYITTNNKMSKKEEQLKEFKEIIQKIINKYLPVESRFSVQDMNTEQIYYVASILSEKDEKKRNEIRTELEKKSKEANKKLKEDYLEILSLKEKYDNIFKSSINLSSLKEEIAADMDLLKKIEE